MADRIDVSSVLNEMRSLRARAQSFEPATAVQDVGTKQVDQAPKGEFQALLTQAVDQVNSLQKTSSQLSQSYEVGDPNVTLAEVMVASQKAGVAFDAMTQVRNRLVSAYEDVMNMPI